MVKCKEYYYREYLDLHNGLHSIQRLVTDIETQQDKEETLLRCIATMQSDYQKRNQAMQSLGVSIQKSRRNLLITGSATAVLFIGLARSISSFNFAFRVSYKNLNLWPFILEGNLSFSRPDLVRNTLLFSLFGYCSAQFLGNTLFEQFSTQRELSSVLEMYKRDYETLSSLVNRLRNLGVFDPRLDALQPPKIDTLFISLGCCNRTQSSLPNVTSHSDLSTIFRP